MLSWGDSINALQRALFMKPLGDFKSTRKQENLFDK